MYKNIGKQSFDIIVAFVVLVMTLPLSFIAWLFLTMANNGKPFFFQTRPGKDERLFKIIKFKTMNDKKGPDGSLLPDAERLTTLGRFIRKTSLDELPQLINVLKGDMSLVGPRPLLPEYLSLYNETQKKRHNVRPGITGWAQVKGRNTLNWSERFQLDVWYVNNLSFKLDMKILYLTVIKVFRAEGVSQDGEATVQYFKGNK